MKWLSMTLAVAGLCLFFLALLLKTTALRRLRFARVVNIASVRRRVPRHRRGRVCVLMLVLSSALMGLALWQTLNIDRSIFALLAIFGAILFAVRLLGFFFTHLPLVIFDIEIDPGSRFSFAHLRHSPFILGGLALVIVGAVIPGSIDGLLHAKFAAYWRAQATELEEWAKKSLASYRDRDITVDGDPKHEVQFFSAELLAGKRILIEGPAGIGKSWFLYKLRYEYRRLHPGNVIVFIDAAKDLQSDGDLFENINRAAFGGFTWASGPVARKMLARALILIDGLDEVDDRTKISNAIRSFSQIDFFRHNTIVVTTRKFDHGLTKEIGFVQARLRLLDERESHAEVNIRIGKLKKASGELELDRLRACCLGSPRTLVVAHRRLDRVPPAEVALFYSDPMPDPPGLSPELMGLLFEKFVKTFFWSEMTVDHGSWREFVRPFLGTYRDIDIVGELFLETLAGEFNQPTLAEMRDALIARFISSRVVENYRPHTGIKDAKSQQDFANRVVKMLTDACRTYMRQAPQATTFKFNLDQLRHKFDDKTLLLPILLESELLTKDAAGNLVFNNTELDKYFLARAREQTPVEAGTPQ